MALAGLAGCDAGGGALADEDVQPTPSVVGVSAVAGSTPKSGDATPAARPSANATTRSCKAADLSAMADDSLRHAPKADSPWTIVTVIKLTNRSSSVCTLSGWAGFTMVGYDVVCINTYNPPVCPPDHAAHRDQKVTRVELEQPKVYTVHPGEFVAFSVLWTELYDRANCGEPSFTDPYDVEIRVPGDQAAVILRPILIQPCDGDVGITALGVIA
ncbi:hypothetical protein GCM10022255_039180 [Dactylosporangium darangshiense]|uniref:DUF4232 domain-containing protein n=2 Tax=Dactylosporangium darangshiense TaxID=579108 RepID=A0ABP8D9C8_9ACTN